MGAAKEAQNSRRHVQQSSAASPATPFRRRQSPEEGLSTLPPGEAGSAHRLLLTGSESGS